GWNNVINMIPARDLAEYRSFSEDDKRWFRDWIEWAATNKEYLRHTRTILGPPALGKVDGTSAIIGNRGYLFLFNPNARRLVAEFSLDASIGVGSVASRSAWGQFGDGVQPAPGPIRVGSIPDVYPTK